MSSFHRKSVCLLLVGTLGFNCAGAQDKTGYYGYGEAATQDEIAGWDIDISPDGTGLPEGSGSVEEGELLYEDQCAECHGSFGEGVGRFPVLAGGEGTLTDQRPSKTVGSYWAYTSTLWDYIRRTMPFTRPESLEDNEVYAITAYVLYLNDLVDDEFILNRANFTSVELPNMNNFVPDPRPDVHNNRCMTNCKQVADLAIISMVLPTTNTDAAHIELAFEKQPKPGEVVYNQYCSLCHKPGLAGAPIPGDSADWSSRVATGMLTLQQRAIKGFTGNIGVMPPKGGFIALTDEEVGEAVAFMMEFSR